MKTPIRIVAVLVFCTICGMRGVQAQAGADLQEAAKLQESRVPAEAKKTDPENMQKLVQEVMAARLSKELGLDEQETVMLLRRLSDYRTQLSAVQKERQEALRALKTLLKENGPDKEIEAALKRLQAVDAKLHDLKRTAYDKIGTGMNVARRARLYVYCNEFENEMRRLVQKAREKNAQGKTPEAVTSAQPPGKE